MVLLSLGGLPFANFKNKYQMTLLVIDHGFKALHPNDSSEKENKDKQSLRFVVLIVVIVVGITTLDAVNPRMTRVLGIS